MKSLIFLGITVIIASTISIASNIPNMLSYMLPLGIVFLGIGLADEFLEPPKKESLEITE